MIITGITELDKRRKRIFIDDEYAFMLYNGEIARYGLKVGEEIDEASLESISELLIRRIKERIFYLIGDMDRTEAAIRSKLSMAGYPDRYVDIAVSELKELSYIDDYKYARTYVENMVNNHGRSRRMIEQGLYQKGVQRSIIEQVMSETDFDDDRLILDALRKKGYDRESLKTADTDTKRRLYNYLLRKGFYSSAISSFFHCDLD